MITKCNCLKCGNPIEFEAEHSGEPIECPHCGQQTVLGVPKVARIEVPATAIKPQKENDHGIRSFLLATAAVVICLFIFGAIITTGSSQNVLGIGGGIVGLIIAGLLLILALLWILFPVFVYFSLGRMEKILKAIERNGGGK